MRSDFAPWPWAALERTLSELASRGRLRLAEVPELPVGRVFCSNDYLGFGAERLAVTSPAGSGSSPLVVGHGRVHAEASASIAAWLGMETATLFSSAYAANIGVLQALGGSDTLFISDSHNHASIIDGCRLSRAMIRVVPHLDARAVAEILAREGSQFRQRWVVTEAYFSMDGDSPDLEALRSSCDAHAAGLVVDEAHGVGLFGPGGRGVCAKRRVVPDVLVGGLGKALGLQGGFVAGPAVLRDALWNRARSFVFSTSMSPLVASCIPRRIEAVAACDDKRLTLFQNVALLRAAVKRPFLGYGPIMPWMVGDDQTAVAGAQRLGRSGFLVRPIRPPTVPEGTARLRITVTASHTSSDLQAFANELNGL